MLTSPLEQSFTIVDQAIASRIQYDSVTTEPDFTEYERQKRLLQSMDLTPQEYQLWIRQIADWLGI